MVGDIRVLNCLTLNAFASHRGVFVGFVASILTCVANSSQDDLTDLALLRLDLMAAIDVDSSTGLPGLIHAAHLLPLHSGELENASAPGLYGFLGPRMASQLDADFLELIDSLEDEMARNRRTTRRAEVRDRTILVGVATGTLTDAEESMAELAELAASADVVVQDKIIQRRSAIDPRTVLGKGKLDELIIRALQLGADMLVFDSELSPAQVRSLSETTDLKIIDRFTVDSGYLRATCTVSRRKDSS